MVRIKCQREFVLKAKMGAEGEKGKKKMDSLGGAASGGSVEDEIKRK